MIFWRRNLQWLFITQSLKTAIAEKIEFNEHRLFSFAVTDVSKIRYNDPSIFTVMLKYYHNVSYFEYKKLKPCSIDDVAFNTSLYESLAMNNSFCLQDKSFYLDGSWEENHISYLALSLFICDNLTSNGTCKSQEEIDAFFNNWGFSKFFGINFHDAQTGLYDKENPFKVTVKRESQFIDTAVKNDSTSI